MSKDEMFKIIKENPGITQADLRKKIGTTHFSSAQLYALVKEGTVKRTISPNTRRVWVLNEAKI